LFSNIDQNLNPTQFMCAMYDLPIDRSEYEL